MHSFATIAAIAGLSGLASALPSGAVPTTNSTGAFNVAQVHVGTTKKVGAQAIQKAYNKYSKNLPVHVAAAATSGTVPATPEQYDAEYLCPVTIGSNTLNLDFDTGSADL
jgi:hypothetical protein